MKLDYANFEEMMRRPADGEAFNIGKALEANFYDPRSDAEVRIKSHIDRYNEQVGKQPRQAMSLRHSPNGGNLDAWLNPAGRATPELSQLLDERSLPYYEHELAA